VKFAIDVDRMIFIAGAQQQSNQTIREMFWLARLP